MLESRITTPRINGTFISTDPPETYIAINKYLQIHSPNSSRQLSLPQIPKFPVATLKIAH